MAKIAYMKKRTSTAAMEIIDKANKVIGEYKQKGIQLTLRQLYYQFVARDWFANDDKNYKRLGDVIADGRLCGLVDWDAIEDRTRFLNELSSYDSPKDLLRLTPYWYRRKIWKDQPVYPEVWIEKDALLSVIEGPCDEDRVPYFACRGYASKSAQHKAAMRLVEIIDEGQEVVIFHLGDHDPSGIHMTDDNINWLRTFVGKHADSGMLRIQRLGLNMDQVEKYEPPPNPAKELDPRFKNYELLHGSESWELDALDPEVIGQLVTDAISSIKDEDKWAASIAKEHREIAKLKKVAENYKD